MRAGRRINRQPIRSPSPDIANRNIIKQTVAPISDILKQSRTMNKGYSIKNVEEWQGAIVQWQEKYRILDEQCSNLRTQNSALNRQVYTLKTIVGQKDQQLERQRDSRVEQSTLRGYENRMSRLMAQIQRMQSLMQQQQDRNQDLEHQNERLRLSPLQNSRNSPSSDQTQKKLQKVKEVLTEALEKMERDLNQRVRLKLNELQDRLMMVQKNQLEIESLLRKRQFQTPRSVKEFKIEDSTEPARKSMFSSEIKKFGRKSIPIDQDKMQLQQKLRQKQSEIQRLALENKQLQLNMLRSSTYFLKSESNDGKQFQNEEECQKCKVYLELIAQYEIEMQKLKKDQQQSQKKQQLQSKNEFERQHQILYFNLEDYLGRIRDIKTILNNQQFRQFINKVNQLVTQNDKLRQKTQRLQEEKQKSDRQSKYKQIELNVFINTLKRQNEVFKTQVKEQDIQISKLKELIDDKMKYQISPDESVNKDCVSDSGSKMFQKYIQQAIQKLQSLQQSMQTTLKE